MSSSPRAPERRTNIHSAVEASSAGQVPSPLGRGRGSCEHQISSARHHSAPSEGVAIPWPRPGCDGDRFDADKLRLSRDCEIVDLGCGSSNDDGAEQVQSSSLSIKADEVSSKGNKVLSLGSPEKLECPTSNGTVVTPMPDDVKSKRDSIFDVTYSDSEDSRFSQGSWPSNGGADPKKEETDDDCNYGGDVMKEETDDETFRFSDTDCPDGLYSSGRVNYPKQEETDEDEVIDRDRGGCDNSSDEDSRFSAEDPDDTASASEQRALDESVNEISEEESTSKQRENTESGHISRGEESTLIKEEPNSGGLNGEELKTASLREPAERSESGNEPTREDNSVTVKEEPTYYDLERREAKNSRKYGDRVLLARQSARGMMKLGGGNQATWLYPKDRGQRMARMGGRYAMAYSFWNFGAPKYAGQPMGHVTTPPRDNVDDDYDPETCPFSVFVMRRVKSSTLGWEYCGEYVILNDIRGTTAAHCVPQSSKQTILNHIKKSLKRENGFWQRAIDDYRKEMRDECEKDLSPPGPKRLVRFAKGEPEPDDEGKEREDRLEAESREKATNAAKIRALGLDGEKLTKVEFAEKLVHYDDFYGSYAVKFVRYDEEMYDFVRAGETKKNKFNKTREATEPCAKASDWYSVMDQQLEENDREVRKKRKRPRSS